MNAHPPNADNGPMEAINNGNGYMEEGIDNGNHGDILENGHAIIVPEQGNGNDGHIEAINNGNNGDLPENGNAIIIGPELDNGNNGHMAAAIANAVLFLHNLVDEHDNNNENLNVDEQDGPGVANAPNQSPIFFRAENVYAVLGVIEWNEIFSLEDICRSVSTAISTMLNQDNLEYIPLPDEPFPGYGAEYKWTADFNLFQDPFYNFNVNEFEIHIVRHVLQCVVVFELNNELELDNGNNGHMAAAIANAVLFLHNLMDEHDNNNNENMNVDGQDNGPEVANAPNQSPIFFRGENVYAVWGVIEWNEIFSLEDICRSVSNAISTTLNEDNLEYIPLPDEPFPGYGAEYKWTADFNLFQDPFYNFNVNEFEIHIVRHVLQCVVVFELNNEPGP